VPAFSGALDAERLGEATRLLTVAWPILGCRLVLGPRPHWARGARPAAGGVFRGITREIPHYVYLALPRGDRPPRLSHPPLRVFWLTEPVFRAGVATHTPDGVSLRIHSPAKTIADCFKYRSKVGIGAGVESLKMLMERGELDRDEILRFARICRVETVMKPYLRRRSHLRWLAPITRYLTRAR